MVFDQIMGKDPNVTVIDEDGFVDIEGDDEDEIPDDAPSGYEAPKDMVFKPVTALPKRQSNLTGREGIKWEEVLEPLTDTGSIGQFFIIFEYNYADDAEMKRKVNLCSSKAGTIRRRLENYASDEDWEVKVRTDVPNKHVGVYVKYLGELTPDRRKEKAEQKARYAARAEKAKANAEAGEE